MPDDRFLAVLATALACVADDTDDFYFSPFAASKVLATLDALDNDEVSALRDAVGMIDRIAVDEIGRRSGTQRRRVQRLVGELSATMRRVLRAACPNMDGVWTVRCGRTTALALGRRDLVAVGGYTDAGAELSALGLAVLRELEPTIGRLDEPSYLG